MELFCGPRGELRSKGRCIFSRPNEWGRLITLCMYLFILTYISCVILKLQSHGGVGFAVAGLRPCLPVQRCVGVIEGVGVLLRRWVYCDPAIFICVSGNYIEKVGLRPWRKRGMYLHIC